ncbi:NACHT nucleoside triphosphatase [Penicillium cf. griseofulvum]|uniref:NACHT nucleoside triphosphatase n=1 Tax=Penicillium cf. griseofulvum TaxID=2972120 RepID=A0A9W9IVI0_9EURO|nr:NACHT nucleoside triphosphatase [Penicillium cf. griseofulvum]KAJ5429280.1 NACHT nucleoside triphosphatase [Penicillium cf. griseofulvum]
MDELPQSNTEAANISFFFFQSPDVRINSATALLCDLAIRLSTNSHLLSFTRVDRTIAGKQVFEDTNTSEALSRVLAVILKR